MVKLATDLDRMTPGAAREIGEGELCGAVLVEHFPNAQQPRRSSAAPQRTSPQAGEQEFHEKSLDGESRHVVLLAEFVEEQRAQGGRRWRGQLAGNAKKSAVFTSERED